MLARRDRITCLLLFLASFLIFLPFIGFPDDYNFDEMHYVNAAKLLVPPQANYNWEHPPLAKYLIGLGIVLGGDTPLGWRLGSMVFGALAISGMYAWALAIFRERKLALWVALLTLVNMMVFVMARIAMLDIFLLAFLVWGVALLSFAWDATRPPAQQQRLLVGAGVLLGLAAACKWVGWVPAIFVLLLWVTLRLLQRSGSRLYRRPPAAGAATATEEWYTPDLWSGIRGRHVLLSMVLLPLAAYALCYAPFLAMPGKEGTLRDIVLLQGDIVYAHSTLTGNHYYASEWYRWPFDGKPMWLYWKKAEGWTRAMLLIGNPVVLLAGFAAVLFCTWVWWRERTRDAFLAVVWYWLLFLCFTVIPRKMSFFHYYLPAACSLGLPLAYIFRHYGREPLFRHAWGRWAFLAVAAAVFLLFYPVLVGLSLPAFDPR